MSLDTFSPEVQFALDAVRRAALVCREVQSGIEIKEMTKRDRTPVTVADFASQAIVAKAMAEALPGARLVGEEGSAALASDDAPGMLAHVTALVHTEHPKATEHEVCEWIDIGQAEPVGRFWTLDPVDGTKGFLRGEQYAVALALIADGQVELGVLACPNLAKGCALGERREGILALAVRGQGAWTKSLNGGDAFTALEVSQTKEMSEARLLRSAEAAHTNTGQLGELGRMLGLKADAVGLDSQAKYALMASGEGDLLFRLLSTEQPVYKEMIWDQAAGTIIVEEAGGRVTDLAGNRLDFSQGRTLAKNRGVCASNGHLHDAALEALEKLGV